MQKFRIQYNFENKLASKDVLIFLLASFFNKSYYAICYINIILQAELHVQYMQNSFLALCDLSYELFR